MDRYIKKGLNSMIAAACVFALCISAAPPTEVRAVGERAEDTETTADNETVTDEETDTDVQTDTDSKADTDAGAGTDSETDTDAGTGTDSETKVEKTDSARQSRSSTALEAQSSRDINDLKITEELDLKRAAKVSGNKSCALIPMKELLGTEWLTPRYFRIGASSLANALVSDIVGEDMHCF